EGVVRSLEEFLNIEKIALEFADALNVSGKSKVEAINSFLKKPNPLKKILGKLMPKDVRKRMRLKVQSTVYKYNLEKIEMKSETRDNLKNIYSEDVLRLQDLIKRDLTSWVLK
ncbi:MAG: sulfotransferase, partial [Chitinophagales bacterium]|nr:sulfotransferase [Chitinophagales bacterium]